MHAVSGALSHVSVHVPRNWGIGTTWAWAVLDRNKAANTPMRIIFSGAAG